MKIHVQGKGEVILGKQNFVAQGGEGQIYAKGNTAYKVYLDAKKMVPAGKIAELRAITDPRILNPQDIFVNDKGEPSGYTMKFLRKARPLCCFFPKSYRNRHGIAHSDVQGLVQQLRKGIQSVHSSGALVVDLNEMNFVIASGEIYFIDVDSYQTPSYPATALMSSVKDWTVSGNQFTELSDWFSFAVVSFQLLTGLHPYKGKHPSIKGFEDRMKQSVSVFNPNVKTPHAWYGVDVIPSGYRAWFEAVLEKGERIPPPLLITGSFLVVPARPTIIRGGKIDIVEVEHYEGNIISIFNRFGIKIVCTKSAIYKNKQKIGCNSANWDAVVFSPKKNLPIVARIEAQGLKLFNLESKTEIPVNIRADDLMSYQGRLYVRCKDKMLHIKLNEAGNRVVPSLAVAAQVLEFATILGPGVVLQNLLGEMFVSIFPKDGETRQIKTPELNGHQILAAKFDTSVLMVSTSFKGKYYRHVFCFNIEDWVYTARKESYSTAAPINFAVNDAGICLCIYDDEKLEVFRTGDKSGKIMNIEDPAIQSDFPLFRDAGKILFFNGNTIYQLSSKKK
jgi:serine/threonine protein kinase